MTSLKEYFARAGGPFTKEDAQVIGPALDELREQHALGVVTGDAIVEIAHSTNHPLHRYFEWDDKKAAHQHRLGQAQQMVREIRVRIVDAATPAGPRRVVHFEPSHAAAARPTRLAAFGGENAVAAQKLQDALQDLEIWRQKYEPYIKAWKTISEALGPLISTVDECLDGVKTEGFTERMDTAIAALFVWREDYLPEFLPWLESDESGKAMIEAIEAAERSLGQRRASLAKPRKCLRCGREFDSTHAGNRMCPTCSTFAAKSLNGA